MRAAIGVDAPAILEEPAVAQAKSHGGPPCLDKKAVEGAMFSSCFFKMRGHVLSAHIKSSLYPKSLLIMVVWAL